MIGSDAFQLIVRDLQNQYLRNLAYIARSPNDALFYTLDNERIAASLRGVGAEVPEPA